MDFHRRMEKMISLFGIVLASVVAVMAEYDCNAEPPCERGPPISDEDRIAFLESGHAVPSDEFLTKHCANFIEWTKCLHGYYKACPVEGLTADIDAAMSNLKEICNPESNIRKGYKKHVDCFNEMNIRNKDCFHSYMQTMSRLNYSELVEAKITVECLELDLAKPCVYDSTEVACGNEAKKVAVDIVGRMWSSADCKRADPQEYENIKKKMLD